MKPFKEFMDAIGERESGNNYRCVNSIGYIGKYQFGRARLYDLDYSLDGWHPANRPALKMVTKENFLLNNDLQDHLFKKHVALLAKIIIAKYPEEIKKYSLSGMIAGAHLKGMGGLKQFIDGKDNADAFGTKISEYI